MKPSPLAYYRAEDVDHATSLLEEFGDDAKILAGGQSLIPMMNFRLAQPSVLIDIGAVPTINRISRDSGFVDIGSMVTHRTVEQATGSAIFGGLSLLPKAMRFIGHLPIRTRGTVGGSVAHGDASAEWPTLACLYEASITARSAAGERRILAEGFFKGFMETDLQETELITEIRFPALSGAKTAISEFARRKGDFALAVAAVAVRTDLDGTCTLARVVVGGVESVPRRLLDVEEQMVGCTLDTPTLRDIQAYTSSLVAPISDTDATEDHKRHLAGVLVRRALADALSRDQ